MQNILNIIAQAIGLIALVFSLASFQFKSRRGIMAAQMTASLLFAVQLFMVGAITGGCLDLISFVRTLIFSNNTKKWASSKLWLYFFAIVMIITGILTWQDYTSILAILGSLLSTVALWMKEPKNVRRISLFVGPCWLIYNLIHGAYTGALNELIAMASIIIGIVRHDRKKANTADTSDNA